MSATALVRVWHVSPLPACLPFAAGPDRPTGITPVPAQEDTSAVTVRLRGTRLGTTTLLLDRTPARPRNRSGSRHTGPARPGRDRVVWPLPADEHLVAAANESDPRWLCAADVVLRSPNGPPPHTLTEIFARLPGCLVAVSAVRSPTSQEGWAVHPPVQPQPGRAAVAAGGRRVGEVSAAVSMLDQHGSQAVIGTAGGQVAWLRPLVADGCRDQDLWLCGSVVHAWMVAGRPFADLHDSMISICDGGRITERTVAVSVIPRYRWLPSWQARSASA